MLQHKRWHGYPALFTVNVFWNSILALSPEKASGQSELKCPSDQTAERQKRQRTKAQFTVAQKPHQGTMQGMGCYLPAAFFCFFFGVAKKTKTKGQVASAPKTNREFKNGNPDSKTVKNKSTIHSSTKAHRGTMQGMGCYHSLLPFFVSFLGKQKRKTTQQRIVLTR